MKITLITKEAASVLTRCIKALMPKPIMVQDGNVLTSQGPGTTLHFAYALVDALGGDGDALRNGMLYTKVLQA